ncbi:aspartic proteinase Asp1-like protein isoform X1 [Tanacetum coccineum]
MQHSTTTIILNLYLLLLAAAAFDGCYSLASQPKFSTHDRSSVVFPVTGNVYPRGYYHVEVKIGNPPKPYWLDIDTGSDLTWLQCDVPCVKCFPAPHKPYKPNKDRVACVDPLCASVHWPETHSCNSPKDQCDYEVQYADSGIFHYFGLFAKTRFRAIYINWNCNKPRLAFGCGYDQEVQESMDPPFTDGILGLGVGKASILRQLYELGVTRNVVGHCLSTQGDGYLFFGDELIPSSGVTWTPMSTTDIEKHYSLGTAELYVGGKTSGIKGLPIVFDSGSTYTYVNAEAYKALVTMLMNDIKGKKLTNANDDKTLPKHGNACLGILNGSEVGLESVNLIGDLVNLDKIII